MARLGPWHTDQRGRHRDERSRSHCWEEIEGKRREGGERKRVGEKEGERERGKEGGREVGGREGVGSRIED